MQATAIVVGISLIIMLIQGLRHGALPAHQTTLTRPTLGLFLAGVALLVIDMLTSARSSRTTPGTCPRAPAGGGCSGPSTPATCSPPSSPARSAPTWPRCCPPRPGRGDRRRLRQVGADHHGPVADEREHLQRLHRVRSRSSPSPACGAGSRPSPLAVRVIPFLAVLAAGIVDRLLGYQQFVTNLSNFLDDLLVIFIPWCAVNLADYFVIRRGRYDVASFFTPTAIYGKVRLARPAGLRHRPGCGMALRLPARLHRPAGQVPRRRRHLLARRAGSPPPSPTCS